MERQSAEERCAAYLIDGLEMNNVKKQLMQEIFVKMGKFVHNSTATCGVRAYLMAATQLDGFCRRLNEITEGNEPVDVEELQEMNSKVENILINIGIREVKEKGSET